MLSIFFYIWSEYRVGITNVFIQHILLPSTHVNTNDKPCLIVWWHINVNYWWNRFSHPYNLGNIRKAGENIGFAAHHGLFTVLEMLKTCKENGLFTSVGRAQEANKRWRGSQRASEGSNKPPVSSQKESRKYAWSLSTEWTEKKNKSKKTLPLRLMKNIPITNRHTYTESKYALCSHCIQVQWT